MGQKTLLKASQQSYLLRRLESIFQTKRQEQREKFEAEKQPKELIEATKELEKAQQKYDKIYGLYDEAQQKRRNQLHRTYQSIRDKTIFMSPEEALKAIDDFEKLDLP